MDGLIAGLVVASVLIMTTVLAATLAWLTWRLVSWLADRLMVAIHVLTRFER